MNKINTFINTFDFDGVIYMGPDFTGLRPCINDIIITGRPISESKFVLEILSERHINNPIHFNPIPREDPEYCGPVLYHRQIPPKRKTIPHMATPRSRN